MSHSATCRERLEAKLQQDEQFTETLRRRDVRHGLAPPDEGPSIAVDLDDPVLESVFTDETVTRSDRLRNMYNRVREHRSTRASGPLDKTRGMTQAMPHRSRHSQSLRDQNRKKRRNRGQTTIQCQNP